jgi:hypothetical protein
MVPLQFCEQSEYLHAASRETILQAKLFWGVGTNFFIETKIPPGQSYASDPAVVAAGWH